MSEETVETVKKPERTTKYTPPPPQAVAETPPQAIGLLQIAFFPDGTVQRKREGIVAMEHLIGSLNVIVEMAQAIRDGLAAKQQEEARLQQEAERAFLKKINFGNQGN